MRRKVESGFLDSRESRSESPAPKKQQEGEKVLLPLDTANEAAIVAATYLFESIRAQLLTRLVPDHFQQREHRELWQLFQLASQRKLVLDLALVEQLGSGDLARYLGELAELRPSEPKNLAYHLQCILWDHARACAARGPIPAFIEALRDPKAEPEKVRALARAIAQSFDGYEDRKYLLDGEALVRDQAREIEKRAGGIACFPYGIPGLDFYVPKEFDGARRMIPGTVPKQMTVVTGVSGSGKTTTTANMVLGIAFPGWRTGDFATPGRTVLYGAWEMSGGMTIEVMAGISLDWFRGDLAIGRGPAGTPEGRAEHASRMATIATRIKFLANPFRRRSGEKRSNERNLDVVQGYVADAGCEVFVADLWKRCLARTEPDEEEEALIRQQMMLEELNVHGILLQQQRLKDIEMRADKRPTRDGIKGSGAWVEVADTIIGFHRPALFKRCDDVTIEAIVLKQRYGKWPLGIEFHWNPETGRVDGGRHVDYDRPGEANEIDKVGGLAEFMRGGKR